MKRRIPIWFPLSAWVLALAVWASLGATQGMGAGRPTNAKEQALVLRQQLEDSVLPYWLEALDRTNGGYVLADDGRGGRQAREKQLVTQARMLWTFSHVHTKGYSRAGRDYLKAAEHGYRFLQEHFLDKEQGGYFWKTDLAGQPTNPRKILYGE